MRDYTPRPKKGMPEKKPKTPLKRVGIKTKPVRDDRNLMKVFVDNWQKRLSGNKFEAKTYKDCLEWFDHTSKYKVCAITYQPIYHFTVWHFLHVLTRNHTKLRESHSNIVMGSMDVHKEFDHGTRARLLKMGPGANFLLEYKDFIKQQYEQGEFL
jgi:hypothetical protein